MKKLFWEFGHQIVNGVGTGAHGFGDEAVEAKRFGIDVAKYMYSKYGINSIADYDDWTLSKTGKRLGGMTRDGDILNSIHFNAFNGSANGAEFIIPNRYAVEELRLASDLATITKDVLGLELRGGVVFEGKKYHGVKTESQSKHKKLYILSSNYTKKCVNLLSEICFIDNKEDWEKYKNNYKEYVSAYGDVLAKHLR